MRLAGRCGACGTFFDVSSAVFSHAARNLGKIVLSYFYILREEKGAGIYDVPIFRYQKSITGMTRDKIGFYLIDLAETNQVSAKFHS